MNVKTPIIPLCIDLDGTLIKGDLLWESWFALLRRQPLKALPSLILLLRGRAAFKSKLGDLIDVDAAMLPYNDVLLHRIREEKALGRPILLVTASCARWAKTVAGHLGLFDDVMATSPQTNLKGRAKARALVDALGDKCFDYAGDSRSDLEIWRHASSAWIVSRGDSLARRAAHLCPVSEVIKVEKPSVRDWLKALRIHQWVKNLLIFVPLLGSHQLDNPQLLIVTVAAFVAFGFVASANYLLNDLLDVRNDRHHNTKRHRALAAGIIAVPTSVGVMALLFSTGFLIALQLPRAFLAVLVLYLASAIAYSFWLKTRAPMDTFTLAGLYTLRVLAGNAVTGIELSFWLLAFSIFLFLSLAMVKRHAELMQMGANGDEAMRGRGYLAADREMISQLGVASGYVAVLVLALYVNSPEATALYEWPERLWLLCLLVLHWVTRVWLLAHRGWLHDDPVVFAIRDRRSQLTAGSALLLLYLAQ